MSEWYHEVTMKLRRAVLCATATAVACLGGESRGDVGHFCTTEDDCLVDLACTWQRCRVLCEHDADCPGGGCIAAQNPAGDGYRHGTRACTLEAEQACETGEGCPTELTCAPDGICREKCVEPGGPEPFLCPSTHECVFDCTAGEPGCEYGVCLELPDATDTPQARAVAPAASSPAARPSALLQFRPRPERT